MNRRQFVRDAACGVSALATATLVAGCGAAPVFDATDEVPQHLRRVLGDDAVERIGRSYLAEAPHEQDAAALRGALASTARRVPRLPWSSPSSPDALIEGDFEAGRTMVVDGWMLSLREARQCALFALAAA
jgi:hypothetical protein